MSQPRKRSVFRASVLTGIAALVIAACELQDEPGVVVGVDGCTECGMVISDGNQAAGYLSERQFRAFCSAGCLLKNTDRMRKQGRARPSRIYFADYLEGGMQPVETVTFLLTEHLPTVMNWGILTFADGRTAEKHRHGEGDVVTDWLGVRRLRGEPNRSAPLLFTAETMDPEILKLKKDELVVLEVGGSEEMSVHVRGYEELGEIVVPAPGETRQVRLLADRPGDGFPVLRSDNGMLLGRIRVSGPHTADEEAE